MEKEKFNDMCRAWHDMVIVNNIFGALQSVAGFFGLADHAARIQAVIDKNNNVGYMRFDVFIDQMKVEKSMLADIRATYGDDIYNSVFNSLYKR